MAREEATVGSREVKHQRFTHLADWTKVAAGDFFIFITMLGDDEDVFDSVTWESPAAPNAPEEAPPSGPGFRQSTATDSGGPNDPKWEGYLFTTVKDPVKELAETKDAYVSYLVSAKVR